LTGVSGCVAYEPVMARVRKGEEPAFAELEFAAALVTSGLTPELEPQLGSRQPDCLVTVDSQRVFAEVIAPDRAEATKDAQAAIQRLADVLVARTTGTRTEVLLELEVEPNTQFESIIASVLNTPADEGVHRVEGIGWIHRAYLASQPPNLGPLIPNPDPPPSINVSRARGPEDDKFTAAVVRLPISDERAHRLFSRELDHFSDTERNILVVRVGNLPRGMEWWLPLTQRWFQPSRNRRVGAVVLYDQSLVGTPLTVRQRWRVVKN